MVQGSERSSTSFSEYTDQYILIREAVCDISFHASDVPFRATRGLDIVLVVEALTKGFGPRFWDFIRMRRYTDRAKSNGGPQVYRFVKPPGSDRSK